MPVVDHPVHPGTVQHAGHRYGCWNLPAELNHRMSNRCRYDMSVTDPCCSGCKHRGEGDEYDAQVRKAGA
jgi:hypothetical protein